MDLQLRTGEVVEPGNVKDDPGMGVNPEIPTVEEEDAVYVRSSQPKKCGSCNGCLGKGD